MNVKTVMSPDYRKLEIKEGRTNVMSSKRVLRFEGFNYENVSMYEDCLSKEGAPRIWLVGIHGRDGIWNKMRCSM